MKILPRRYVIYTHSKCTIKNEGDIEKRNMCINLQVYFYITRHRPLPLAWIPLLVQLLGYLPEQRLLDTGAVG